jgi:hypothetical protein
MSYPTLSETLDAVQKELPKNVILEKDYREEFTYGGISYETSKTVHIPIVSINGKKTKKYFHISIYRLHSGNYELVSYVS